ncbi:MAG: exodeoxyribonuclease VII small subunit [Clostridiales Family XIII bacterium]|jgi:exodeoxyribonuclease VII small subunit|nr:exodeoxyribonuclease VII small subunit [Clostridiales Family XIII bacterium]
MTDKIETIPENIKFEEAMKKLEDLAAMLQDQSVPLDEAIAAYEGGLKYYEVCKKILDEANQKIVVIDENGVNER